MNATYLPHLTPVEDDRISVILRMTEEEFVAIFKNIQHAAIRYDNETFHKLCDFVEQNNIKVH